MKSSITALCCACAALWLTPAAAQSSANGHPTDPRTEVRAQQYQSAFTGYQPFREEKTASWRDVNDEAARVGGHLGIFMGGAHAGHGTAPQAHRAAPGKNPQGMTK
ncbi:MAG: hypothetical protein ACO3F9_13905 [Burkholderiales bacterium]